MKKLTALILVMIMTASSVTALAGTVYSLPSQVPESVYRKPYNTSQFTTAYAPWLENFHLMNENEYNKGLNGGEGCQLIRCMDISPVNSDIMYFITDTSGVFISENGGKQWYNTNNNIVSYYGAGLLCDRFDENTVYAYIAKDGAYKSTNRGKVWERILDDDSDFKGFTSNRFAMDAGGNLYIAAGSGIYILRAGEKEPVNLYKQYAGLTGDSSARFSDICVTDDGKNIYATGMFTNAQSKFVPGLYITHDGGESWEVKNFFEGDITQGYSVTLNPENENHIFLSAAKRSKADGSTSQRGLYESLDGGQTFEKTFVLTYENAAENVAKSERNFYKLRFGPKNENGVYPLYMVGNETTFPFRCSYDMGKSFETLVGYTGEGTFRQRVGTKGETGWYYEPYALDMNNPGVFFFAGVGVHKYDNGDIWWSSSGFSGASITYITMSEEGKMFLTLTDVGCVVGEGKFTEDSYPFFTVTDSEILTMAVIDPMDDKHIIGFSGNSNTGSKTIGICESFDGGYTFGKVREDAVATRNTEVLKYDVNNPNIIYSSEHTSYDNGKTWVPNEYFILDISRTNSNKMVGVKGKDTNTEIYVSEDGGKTWTFSSKPGFTLVGSSLDVADDNFLWYSWLYDFGKLDLRTGVKKSLKSKFDYQNFHYFAQNPKNADHIVLTHRPNFGDMSKTGWLYESTDGGESFHVVPGLYSVGFLQRLFFSTTTDEVLVTGHRGTYIYNYNKYQEFLKTKIAVMLNDKEISFSVMPHIVNNYAVVPMRELFEKLGATVSWDEKTQTVTAKHKNGQIKLTVGSDTAIIKNKQIKMPGEVYIENGKTMVPITAVSEGLDLNVGWDEDEKIIIIKE